MKINGGQLGNKSIETVTKPKLIALMVPCIKKQNLKGFNNNFRCNINAILFIER